MLKREEDILKLLTYFGPSVGNGSQGVYEQVLDRELTHTEFILLRGQAVEAKAAGKTFEGAE